MKLCLLSLSFKRAFTGGDMTVEAFLDVAREFGMDGVDLHANTLPSTDHFVLDRIGRACLDRGLSIACLSIGNSYAGPEAGLYAQIAGTHDWIRAAARLGPPQVRLFAGTPPAGEEAVAWIRCASALRQSAAFGAELGVRVSLQNHNHGQLVQTGADMLRMRQAVAHPNLGHVLDCGQYAGSPGASGYGGAEDGKHYDYLASIDQTAPLATHVRAKIYQIQDGRETSLNYDRIFESLRAVAYNGWVSLVYEGKNDEHSGIAAAVPVLRRFIACYSTFST